MTVIQIFPYAVAGLELCAAIMYAWHRDWRLCIVWGCVGIANFAFAGIK